MQNNVIEHTYEGIHIMRKSKLFRAICYIIDIRNKNENLNCFFSMQGRYISNCNELG